MRVSPDEVELAVPRRPGIFKNLLVSLRGDPYNNYNYEVMVNY